MHPRAYAKWEELTSHHVQMPSNGMAPMSVLDVGSFDLNGTLKPIMIKFGNYTGIDLVNGPNVDVVVTEPYRYPFPNGNFDLIVSNATVEHIQRPWVWMTELARLTAIGGMVIVMNPTVMPYHAQEISNEALDCWRILKDGMRLLMNDAGLDVICADQDDTYCWGVGRAP